jgi:phosphohistidine phosphatase
MIVYLLRHGIAEDTSDDGADESRGLTDEGREKLSALLHRAAHAGVKPEVILTSPYKRALQTARLASRILGGPDPIVNDSLVPHGSSRSLWNDLRDYHEANEVLMASHEPLLSNMASYFLNSPAFQVEVKKGAMIAIEFAALRGEPRGTLRWMLIPRLCV